MACCSAGGGGRPDADGARLRRSVSYEVYEGRDGLWGGALPPDLEVPDAEMYAVYAYMQRCARRAAPQTQRLLIQSDCLGVLDAIDAAWRAGTPAPLHRRDRGATLEAICRLRTRFDRVIFMYVPSHTGIAPNAYADAAAKAFLFTPWTPHEVRGVADAVHSRPCLYACPSDYTAEGYLRQYEAATAWVTWDRAVFRATRIRSARWLEAHMAAPFARDEYEFCL